MGGLAGPVGFDAADRPGGHPAACGPGPRSAGWAGSAAERRQIIDDFTAEVFQGLEPSPARSPRWAAAPELPDDPSAEQVEAWIDLAELVADRAFRAQIRQVTEIGVQIQAGQWLIDVGRAQEEAEAARQRGVSPGSAEAAQVVAQILAGTPASRRQAELLAQLEAATDPRIERYWQLTAIISGRGPFPSSQPTPRPNERTLVIP
jgi:hypothetical protein